MMVEGNISFKRRKGRWSFRYQRNGQCHEMGCGIYPEVTIAMSREQHESYKKSKFFIF